MKKINLLISLISGGLLPLAFAPCYLWPLAILAPMGLLFSITSTKEKLTFIDFKPAFLNGFVFGVGLFTVGASWIFISIHTYGNTNIPIAGLITGLFVLILSLFPALQASLTTRIAPKYLWLSFPAFGVLLEWVRGWFFSGFPWLLLGQSQTLGLFKSFAPVLGVYGLSFILLLMSVSLFLVLRQRRWSALIPILLFTLGGYALSFVHWTKPAEQPLKISMLQGNIPQEIKWSPEQLEPTLMTYVDMTKQSWGSDLIFWPEGAVPLPIPAAQPFLDSLSHLAKAHHTSILLGIPAQIGEGYSYYNALTMVGENSGFYYKRHLVPFGEYVPLASLLRGLIGFFDIPMSDFLSGPRNQPLFKVNGITLGTFICYEIAYPGLLHDTIKQHPDFLATLSNDAWFGESLAPYQHAQISQFAALITGRYLVLNANSGLTAIYDPQGNLVQAIPLFTRDRLPGAVYASSGDTPWNYLGDTPFLIMCGVLLVFGYGLTNKGRINAKNSAAVANNL